MIVFKYLYFFLFLPFIVQAQNELNEVSFFSSQKRQEVLIRDLAEWEQQRWKILEGMEAVMGPLPGRFALPAPDMRIVEEFKNETYTRLTIDFMAVEDERVSAYLYIPYRKGVDGKLPGMVALHPTGADGKKIVDGEGRANRGYAKELAERGYIVIAPDYPSFGGLTNFDFDNDRYQSGTMAGIFYHMRCVDLLVERGGADPARIGVIGHSLGGHNAMFLAAFDNRIKVVVSSCGWTQFEYYDVGEIANERYGGRLGPWAQDRYMPFIKEKYNLEGEKIPFNFHEIIALFAPRAFFSNSPLNDGNFDVKGVIKGVGEARKIYRFMEAGDNLRVRYPEAEHDFPEEIRLEAYKFIDQILKHTPNKHDIRTETN